MSDERRPEDRRALLSGALQKLEQMQARLDLAERAQKEPIAIIGLGCRFPGAPIARGVLGVAARWASTPSARCPPTAGISTQYYDPNPDTPGKMYTRFGRLSGSDRPVRPGVLRHLAARGGQLSTRSSGCCWKSRGKRWSTPGMAPGRLRGSRDRRLRRHRQQRLRAAAARRRGADDRRLHRHRRRRISVAAGPPVVLPRPARARACIDTACSSSLVAVHLACQSLRHRRMPTWPWPAAST